MSIWTSGMKRKSAFFIKYVIEVRETHGLLYCFSFVREMTFRRADEDFYFELVEVEKRDMQ